VFVCAYVYACVHVHLWILFVWEGGGREAHGCEYGWSVYVGVVNE